MSADAWPRIAVVGAGAVGGYFGGMLARAGAPVMFIGRPAFVGAVKQAGLQLDTLQFKENVKVEASTELSAVRGVEIVLFCVKTTDTAAIARELAPLLAENVLVVSMQNGVDNAEQIHAASGLQALAAAVYVAASVPSPGTVKHVGRGDLVVGPRSVATERVASVFERAGVPCRISDHLAAELWTKLVWNCGLNAISALGKARYGDILANEDARKLVEGAIFEVVFVAKAAGVHLPLFDDPKAAVAGGYKIAQAMAATRSSTAQDMMRNKKTEIDSLNGFVVRKGRELGVPTPINHALFTLVRLAESAS
ncbi:MAG TPA: 2-dehydropantoate 2-reductase [Candidatus Eisenbacteria bacterium]|jgi:2-dehydropantoate 2-reductase|nr:2-dehydropantoate 2-reductase [Candidatus Eisenbacteria bacterium]